MLMLSMSAQKLAEFSQEDPEEYQEVREIVHLGAPND
jgi:hypothetical protein